MFLKSLLFLFFPLITYGQDVDSIDQQCLSRLVMGKFKTKSNLGTNIIIRYKGKQIESFNGGSSVIYSKIKWEEDNVYILKIKKIMNYPSSSDFKRGSKIKVVITSCDNYSYTCDIMYSDKVVKDVIYEIMPLER